MSRMYCLIFCLALSSSGLSAQSTGNLLMPRYGPTAVTDGQWIYVFGGAPHGGRNGKDFVRQGLHASIERINPSTLKAEYFSSGLHRRANHASVYTDNKFFTCGGRTQVGVSRPWMASCEFLDFSTGFFRELPALPDSLRTLGMTEVNGDLYVIGGHIKGNNYSSGTYRLTKGRNNWEHLADLPVGRQGPVISVKDKIYAIGGYNGSSMTSVMVYNTGTNSWENKGELPYGLSAYSTVTDGEFIYVFGDYVKMDAIHRYAPVSGDLFLLDQKMTPRRHTAATLVNNRAVVIGGNQTSSGAALTLIEAFDLADLREGGTKLERDR